MVVLSKPSADFEEQWFDSWFTANKTIMNILASFHIIDGLLWGIKHCLKSFTPMKIIFEQYVKINLCICFTTAVLPSKYIKTK